jgi:hypothetical protein
MCLWAFDSGWDGMGLFFWISRTHVHPKTQDEFEMQANAIQPGQTVVIVDDIIATGAYFQSSIFADCHEIIKMC